MTNNTSEINNEEFNNILEEYFQKQKEATEALQEVINNHSLDELTGIPDYILAKYLYSCLEIMAITQNELINYYHGEHQDSKE